MLKIYGARFSSGSETGSLKNFSTILWHKIKTLGTILWYNKEKRVN